MTKILKHHSERQALCFISLRNIDVQALRRDTCPHRAPSPPGSRPHLHETRVLSRRSWLPHSCPVTGQRTPAWRVSAQLFSKIPQVMLGGIFSPISVRSRTDTGRALPSCLSRSGPCLGSSCSSCPSRLPSRRLRRPPSWPREVAERNS